MQLLKTVMIGGSLSNFGSRASRATLIAGSVALIIILRRIQLCRRRIRCRCCGRTSSKKGYESLIGNTPLVKLERLSSLLGQGRAIFVKMESMNPGGTGKDRAALYMLRNAEDLGNLPQPVHIATKVPNILKGQDLEDYISFTSFHHDPLFSSYIRDAICRTKTGGIVVEGSSGSTGISLATLSAQRGHSVIIVMPDDQAQEKRMILASLGAIVYVVPTASISNPNHYVNVARRITESINNADRCYIKFKRFVPRTEFIVASFMNQFENESNYYAHYHTTGPEIVRQVRDATGRVPDAFVMSAGTGGTISGVGRYMKEFCDSSIRIVLVDPPGSCLYNKVVCNVAFAIEQQERSMLRHRYDTIAEGIGLDRITRNFALGMDAGVIDDAIRISDQEALDVAHWILREEGFFVGSSSAMNICAAARVALDMEPDTCLVTIICDGAQRHLSRFWNRDFVIKWGLKWPGDDITAWSHRLPQSLQVITT